MKNINKFTRRIISWYNICMINGIRIKCPAKINLTLEVVNRREDGFHNIKSIMQLINSKVKMRLNIEFV